MRLYHARRVISITSLLLQMFISSGNTQDIHRVMCDQMSEHLMAQSSWHIQIIHHGVEIWPKRCQGGFDLILLQSPGLPFWINMALDHKDNELSPCSLSPPTTAA